MSADQIGFLDPTLLESLNDGPVLDGGIGTQLAHVAQYDRFGARIRLAQEVVQRGLHARGVGVVAVRDQRVECGLPLLRPVVVRIVALDGRDDLGTSDPEIKADRYGGRDVAAVVVSDQTRADGQTVPSRFDEGFCSDRLGRRVGNSPQSGARFDHRFQTVAVVQPKGGPSACNQRVEQLALAPHDALFTAEAL